MSREHLHLQYFTAMGMGQKTLHGLFVPEQVEPGSALAELVPEVAMAAEAADPLRSLAKTSYFKLCVPTTSLQYTYGRRSH